MQASTTYLVTTEIVRKDSAVYPKVISFEPADEKLSEPMKEAIESMAHFLTIKQYKEPFTSNAVAGDTFTHEITITTTPIEEPETQEDK
ncbi:hypothetical protein [uncultured Pontibacter sp.]|uniref:hypothetical protein n=1 Tax=uncultured Pontibacter sp. TaxID=453356 RepID=UPI00262FB323|nr:hypothetical protein [uncultured Pontibacter sp.]